MCKKEEFDRIYAEYNCELRENNNIDFDDMVIICNEIFKNDEKHYKNGGINIDMY